MMVWVYIRISNLFSFAADFFVILIRSASVPDTNPITLCVESWWSVLEAYGANWECG